MNVVSVSTAPAEQERDRQADDGDHGNERVPERVVVDDRVLVDPARPRCLDVVVLHRADHVHPDQPDEHARRHEPEGDRGQDQVPDHVLERGPVAVDDRVDREDVRVGLERRLRDRAGAIRDRQPAEVAAEEELRQQARGRRPGSRR